MAKNQNNNVAPATQKTEPGAKKDALATALAQIEKQFGKGAIMKLGDNTAMQVDAISTGSLGLDLALGVGGVPRGRIIEVFGPESSGKTTLALHILAEAPEKGRRGGLHRRRARPRPGLCLRTGREHRRAAGQPAGYRRAGHGDLRGAGALRCHRRHRRGLRRCYGASCRNRGRDG